MELLIKLYRDQPPRLGIVYPGSFKAERAYKELLDTYKDEDLRAGLEINGNTTRLILTGEKTGKKTEYKDLNIIPEQIQRLQKNFPSKTRIQLVNIYREGDSYFIAKTKGADLVPLFISQYEIISPDTFGDVM